MPFTLSARETLGAPKCRPFPALDRPHEAKPFVGTDASDYEDERDSVGDVQRDLLRRSFGRSTLTGDNDRLTSWMLAR
jgi:hypothetical protein